MTTSTRRAAKEAPFHPTYHHYLNHVVLHKAIGVWELTVPHPGEEAELHTFPTFTAAKDYIRSIAYETYLISGTLPDGNGVGGKYVALSARKAARLFARGRSLPSGTLLTVDGPDGCCHFICRGRGKIGLSSDDLDRRVAMSPRRAVIALWALLTLALLATGSGPEVLWLVFALAPVGAAEVYNLYIYR